MNTENPAHTPLPGDEALPYRQLFEAAKDGMVLLNGETGRILQVNRAFAEMSGYTPDELAGKPLWEIAPMQATDAGLVAFRELMTRDHIYYDDLPFERRGGKRINVDLACTAHRTGGTKLIHCTFRDITRRKETEDELERSEARFKALFRNAPLGIAFVDNEGWVIESNSSIDRTFGYGDHELRGKHFSHFSYPDDQATDEALFRELVEGKRDAYHLAMRYLRKDGGTAWGLLGAAAVRGPNGEARFIIRMVEDITERKQAEDTLLRSRDFYRSLLNELPNPIRLTDTNGNCDYFNRAWLDFTGLQQEQELGVGWTQGLHPEDAERVLTLIHDSLLKRGPFVAEYRLRRAAGEYRWLIEFGSPYNGMDGRFAGYISSCYDIHERKALEDALHAISMTDDLTGLLNRRGFSTLAEQQIKIANRTKRGLLLVYTDLDGLKLINDTQGHREGDRVLTETAALLREVFRESDIIGRLGGDEFAVLMMEDAGEFDGTMVLDRLHAAVRSRNARAAGRSLLSMSIGVQPYDPEHPCSLDRLIEQADVLMYEEKKSKKRA